MGFVETTIGNLDFVQPSASPIVTTEDVAAAGRAAGVPIATVELQNAGAGPLAAGVATFGQVFAQGELPAGGKLLATIGGAAVAVQVDVKTTYADGSAKMAVLSVMRPEIAAGAAADLALARGAGAPAAGPAVDLAGALAGHSFAVDLAVAGQPARHVDVLAALQDALAGGTASVWQRGELATQARVEVAVPGGSQRLVFDVTAFKGGGLQVDAQFNNDRAMEAAGGRVAYQVTATMDGRQVLDESVDQAQYQNWRREFSSNEADGGQGTGDPAGGWLNVVQDVARLGRIGAVADYDTTLGVPASLLQGYQAAVAAPGWGDPLAANGVTQFMPQTGGRPDIGITTQATTAWLLSGDARAAAYAMGQAEAAGAVPWNFWDARNGSWLSTDDHPRLWTSPMGGVDPQTTALTQPVPQDTGWTADNAHQPDLSYVPYLLTGERWVLDNLQAQAAYGLVGFYAVPRGFAQDLVVPDNQVRAAAWTLRQLDEAAWTAPDGSPEKAYFQAAVDANWTWLVSKIPEWTAAQGEVHGWVPGDYREPGATAPWQQDYFASTAIAAASRGNQDALAFLNWQKNFLVGRFGHAADGFNPHDGVAYSLAVMDPATGVPFKTWAEVGAATEARGLSNGDGWADADYGQLALATLAGIYHLTGDAGAAAAYRALALAGPPHTGAADFAAGVSWAVTIPGIYGPGDGLETGPGAGDDVVTLAAATDELDVDLGAGYDRLTLADGGNAGTVRGTEVLVGGAGRDVITIEAAAGGTTVDLRGDQDLVLLSSAGPNSVALRNVERVVGGAAADAVALRGSVDGVEVDLGAGDDRLVLSWGGANSLTVANVETIVGGSADDDVTLGAPASRATVDLRGGADRLVLPDEGTVVTAVGVEVVVGGGGADRIALKGTPGAAAFGNGGDDVLVGGSYGGTFVGGPGRDTMTGGAGADRFVFTAAADSPAWDPDTITDLAPGVDVVVFSGTAHADLAWRGAAAFDPGGGAQARFAEASRQLQVDFDGDGAADLAVVLGNVGRASALSFHDFAWE